MTYYYNGNIDTKPGVGTYLYEAGARPHALTGIADGTAGAGVESGIMQEIGYTAFNKVSHVQHHGGNNDRYEIRYGLDRQRIKSTYYVNGGKAYDRYYLGTYEKDVAATDGRVTHTDYIYAPTGLAAICRQQGKEVLYVLTDHMGSVQVLADAAGRTVTEYRYEAWGGRVLVSGEKGLTDRGYTGHEHLEPLGLIDMNGRIYDPTLARFLSPDPYVQGGGF